MSDPNPNGTFAPHSGIIQPTVLDTKETDQTEYVYSDPVKPEPEPETKKVRTLKV